MAGEKINQGQVSNLLDILRTDVSIDIKTNLINQVKSGIKRNNVPEACIIPLFEATRVAMSSQQAAIASAGFTTLGHLLSRLLCQEPKYIVKESARTLPLIMEKMGDIKEKYRQLAAQCLTIIWNKVPSEVEKIVKSTGLTSKNSRMKDTCMCWIVQTHQENAMPFKNYVSSLVSLLEDADGMVRDTARNSVIALFQDASNTAKSDLKRQLKIYNVRPAIVSAIIAHLGPANNTEAVESNANDVPSRSIFANSVPSISNSRSLSQAPEILITQVEPLYVNTQRELESIFQEMGVHFEGKESDQNWLKREQSCTMLRRLNAGNAQSEFHDSYLAGFKGLLDGILKAVNSLRTSLSKEGCCLIQEIAKTVGIGLDPMVEILLQNLIKLCGGTKKISSQQGNITVDIILSKVSYNTRILQHVWAACQDKNVQPRTYAAGWLRTLLKKESHHKSHIEHAGSLDIVEKCIKKGLADANPGVRETMRSTYWTFSSIWPARAEGIMASLDATQQKLLDNAPENPNSPKKVKPGSARPGLGFSKSTSASQKPSLKDALLAQKKAVIAHKILPTRPGSAMSSFSPVRSITTSTSADTLPGRFRLDSTISHGGLSVAPMRPSKLKAAPKSDLTTRPATAGPYSVRRPGHAPSYSESSSSPSVTSRGRKSRTISTSTPKSTTPRPSTSLSSYANHSNNTTPKKNDPRNSITSPHTLQLRPKSLAIDRSPRYLSNRDEEMTFVAPSILNDFKRNQNRRAATPVEPPEEILVTSPKRVRKLLDPFVDINEQMMNIRASVQPLVQETAQAVKLISKIDQDRNEISQRSLTSISSEKLKQDPPLLDSGIKKVLSQSLDVHGFRKLQEMVRESKSEWTENKFEILITGLFDYLEAPLISLEVEKRQNIKVQILATIKLMLKRDLEAFRPHVIRGLESLLTVRSAYNFRAYIVSGLEILSSELIKICEPSTTIDSVLSKLKTQKISGENHRSLSMGLHMLKELLSMKINFAPNQIQLTELSQLAKKCLNCDDSGVRMVTVQLCVAIHARVGGDAFWKVLDGMKDDPKSLITYYIVKQQKEFAASTKVAV